MTVLLSPYCDEKLKLCGNISLSIEKNKNNNSNLYFHSSDFKSMEVRKDFRGEYLIITKKQIINST